MRTNVFSTLFIIVRKSSENREEETLRFSPGVLRKHRVIKRSSTDQR